MFLKLIAKSSFLTALALKLILIAVRSQELRTLIWVKIQNA